MTPARTRIAPSPTGYVHIGTLRTALYNYFLAKQTGGKYIIRIEDTDRERLVEGSVENLLETMKFLGLEHDEGPVIDKDGVIEEIGEYGPYTQSARLHIYADYVNQLISQGNAYHCFCSKERLTTMREEQQATKQSPKYDRTCLRLSENEVQAKLSTGENSVVRLKIPEGETIFEDAVRGLIKINNSEVDDQVILKADGFPTYHLAVVVDDHLMKITHILRGEEWISSTPKHVLLYKMFGWEAPVFAHLPLLLNPDKSKLSKRQGDVAVEDYLKRGYLPKALINFVSLLGFNPKGDQELYEIEEFTELFDLSKVNKSGAVLNMEKLDWMNNHYLKALSRDELKEVARPFVQANVDNELVLNAIMIERERVSRLDELQEKIGYYLEEPAYDGAILIWKKADAGDAKAQLEGMLKLLQGVEDDALSSIEQIETLIKNYIEANGLSNGNVLWPLRTALSGREKSSSPFELIWALGKTQSLNRIEKGISLL
ncbi:glutamate--tRNA ligase [Candidatus Uhrbacteria bacterium CG_4_9_14_3_um_filter_41_35]|uniref:Glutamate--tRNA ligase n=1 Tax=Candidatus Uhrbacteria bacterium CG_4_9_14_3_um_filter_41_35 TaxID=1975034 RepID=A0A2M7XFP6_9BACT|nr:MAG: glutamate--tRNA ligase [Candidatus Uhrbacteria bacterium CG11_big_fil_rev_8_21_14_0_20_41_9]PJA46556.1 MAG: glutamate--tRNA ligase [Candidatus Uhrbacteria bacterium CG_4_9_14_3_um_filter_41_35]